MEFTAKEIAEALQGTVQGDENCVVSGVSEIDAGKPKTLTFLANPKYEKYIYTTEAAIVLVNNSFEPEASIKATLIKVPDAYAAMGSLLEMYEQSLPKKVGIEQPSFIAETASVGENVYVGAFAYIGEGVTIGNNVQIYPNVYIGDNVSIADNSKILAGVKICSHTEIGANCTIQAGAVVGSDGFGFAPQEDGSYKKIPQLGKVVLEDNVDIGANACIDRAMMGTTRIKSGVKIDNLVQIAHNCEIGKDTVIAALSGVAGSTKVGKNCVFGGQVGVVGHISVPDGVKVQAQSGITARTKPHTSVMGTPAIDVNTYYKSYAHFKRLGELNKEVNRLKKQLDSFISEK